MRIPKILSYRTRAAAFSLLGLVSVGCLYTPAVAEETASDECAQLAEVISEKLRDGDSYTYDAAVTEKLSAELRAFDRCIQKNHESDGSETASPASGGAPATSPTVSQPSTAPSSLTTVSTPPLKPTSELEVLARLAVQYSSQARVVQGISGVFTALNEAAHSAVPPRTQPGNPTPGSPQNQPTAQGAGSGASGPNPAEGQGSPKPTSAAINSDDDVLSSNETKLKRRLNEFDRLMDEQKIPQRAKGSQGAAQSSAQPSGSPSASTGSTSQSEGASPEGQSAATADGQEGNPQDGSPSGSTTDGSENPSSSEQELGRSLAEFDQTLDDAASSEPLAKVDIQAIESTSVGKGSREAGSESPVSGTQTEATDPSDEVADSGDEERTDITPSGTGGSGPKDGTVEDDVARLLREAAEKETDATRKEALWEQYNAYMATLSK